MKAMIFEGEAGCWTDVDRPLLGEFDVRVEVKAAGVNRADLVQLAGRYAPPPGASQILGLEAAGVVSEVGSKADTKWIGKRVAVLLSGGGYAEEVNVHQDHLLEMPDAMSFVDGAAIPEAFLTAFINLFSEGSLQPGERVLLHAAASGVGVAALQLCDGTNEVVAVCSGEKHVQLKQFSPATLIDRHNEAFEEVVQAVGNVDVILDPVGGSNLGKNLSCLNRRGRLVNIGLLGGREGTLNMGMLLVKRLQIIGSVLRSRSIEEKSTLIELFRNRFWPRFDSGELRAIVHQAAPIHEVSTLHTMMRQNENVGKLVMTIAD